MISVVILGAGNVATHLYKAFKTTENVNVLQWYNRNIEAISSFKNEVDITDNLSQLAEADVYIVSVSDDAVKGLTKKLPFENRLVVHTSGTVKISDIDKKHHKGVFYPLQSFSKSAKLDFANVPICIEAITSEDYHLLKDMAIAIGSPTKKVNSDQRKVLHLAAVFVNNFTNQLYRVAHEITESEGAEFDLLKPLILETAKKVQDLSPYMAQTGPAKRDDKKTLDKHTKLLTNPHHKDIYDLLTKSIQHTHGRKKL
ncbi:Rossmann-like and DUF2520 domain-containing protein [Aestuariibaculum marinum]|uniref:DUF2520 domain-containing protein n=1 Tax=Aestuariibaculum marinum TaxID=2683592 RepID=A0A8J6PRH7_9FLAO|nr:DUF2520 domain-containing protein [Aestuariibaculum marinum]MBD0822443.1 DUF2520 domain-containing protein [Aestuariibaculum marinum]